MLQSAHLFNLICYMEKKGFLWTFRIYAPLLCVQTDSQSGTWTVWFMDRHRFKARVLPLQEGQGCLHCWTWSPTGSRFPLSREETSSTGVYFSDIQTKQDRILYPLSAMPVDATSLWRYHGFPCVWHENGVSCTHTVGQRPLHWQRQLQYLCELMSDVS